MGYRSICFLTMVTLLAGCGGGSSGGPEPISFSPGAPPAAVPFVAQYAPPVNVGPYPNDILFAGTMDGTLEIPELITRPLTTAVNTLDGFSTTAKITAPFNAPLDQASLIPFDFTAPTGTETIFVLDATNGVPLVPNVDYSVGISQVAGTGGQILEITPIRPLLEKNTYLILLTSGIMSTGGQAAGPDQIFQLVRDAHFAGVMTGNPDLDALLPVIGPLLDAGVAVFGLAPTDIVSAWSVSTQSITDVLNVIDQTATAQVSFLQATGASTADFVPGVPGIADVYVGFLEIPYYMDPTDIGGSFWVGANGQLLTRFNPTPLVRTTLRIPMLASLPNVFSGQAQPPGGWPVAIYQHGVTDNRTSLLAIADSMAQAGIAVVAIDLPLHGITDPMNPLYQGPGGPLGDNERHFNADTTDPLGLPGADGIIDSGAKIFNIANPLNALGYIRQFFADQTHLVRTIPIIDFNGDMAPDLDPTRIHFVGMSLGSIFASVFLGINDEVTTATMSSPAGPWSSLLTDAESISFGAPLRGALAAQGIPQGTQGFDDFVRDLQTIVDSGDPTNFAESASMLHPIHAFEIVGDITVPNTPTETLASLWGLADVSTTLVDPAGARGIVRILNAAHTSLLNPATNPEATIEMQTQMATFAASNGTTILVTNTDVVQ